MSTSALAAGCLAAAAVITTSVGTAGRWPPTVPGAPRPVRSFRGALERGSARRLAPAVWAASAALVLLGPATLAMSSLLAASAVSAFRMRSVRARRAAEAATAAAVADAAVALAADLAAGHAPHAALTALSSDLSAGPLAERLGWVSATGSLGGDVPTAFRVAATTPGAESLRDVAAAWQVAEQTGSPLGPVLDQVARGITQRQSGRRRLEISMAGARTSARLLVALPAFGLLIGAGLGVSPLAFLLGPLVGRVCLVAGLALSAAGLIWTDRLAASALAEGGRRS